MQESKPSVTAAVVASTLLLLEDDRDLGPLVDPSVFSGVEVAVRSTIPAFGYLLDVVPMPVLKRAAAVVENALSPGFVAHYALRKHAVSAAVRAAIDDGARQVVLVGAGFDMLGRSIPAAVRVVEVDHPATQAARREAYRAHGRREITFVAADLARDRLAEVLRASAAFDPAMPTVVVAEGLLMYLASAEVAAFLRDVQSLRPMSFVFTVVTPDDRGRLRLHSQRRLVDWVMRWLDEPFVWGKRREDVDAWLAPYGFVTERVDTTFELRARVLPERAHARLPRATGELLVVARSNDTTS